MDVNDKEISNNDPQFVNLLKTCLKMEIAAGNKKLDVNNEEIKTMKIVIRNELNKRKQLKDKMAHMEKIRTTMSDALEKFELNVRETSGTLEVIKANADDEYKLFEQKSKKHENLVAKYKEIYDIYHNMYEEFPLAKARKAAKVNLAKVQIEEMALEYKNAEMIKMIKQREHIDWIRIRSKIAEFAQVMVERKKLEETFLKLKVDVDYYQREFESLEMKLQVLRKTEEDKKRLREQEMLEMAPPKINIPLIYTQSQMHKNIQHPWKIINESSYDTISINTIALEELCINENSTLLDEMDMQSPQMNDSSCIAFHTETPNPKNSIVSEKTDTCAALIAQNVQESAEEATLADNNVEMKEIHQEKTKESLESIKVQAGFHMGENLLKHCSPKNKEDEIEIKRIKLQSENDKRSNNKITNAQASAVLQNKRSPSSLPKVKKIESVHYNVVPISETVRSVNDGSSIFSPTHHEYCESNISFADHDSVLRDASLHEGSLCNFRSFQFSNMSLMYDNEDAQMAPILKQDNKKQSNEFVAFTDFATKTKNDFNYF